MTVENVPGGESRNDEEGVKSPLCAEVYEREHWFAGYPFFEPVLTVRAGSEAETVFEGEERSQQGLGDFITLSLFDCDGALLQEVEVPFREGPHGVTLDSIPLAPLLGACKFEGGMKHGRVQIRSARPFQSTVRLNGFSESLPVPCPQKISRDLSAFVPVSFRQSQSSVIIVTNCNEAVGNLRCRLFWGNRSPEVTWNIPGFGARCFHVEQVFADLLEGEKFEGSSGYLRLAGLGSYELDLYSLEYRENDGGRGHSGFFLS